MTTYIVAMNVSTLRCYVPLQHIPVLLKITILIKLIQNNVLMRTIIYNSCKVILKLAQARAHFQATISHSLFHYQFTLHKSELVLCLPELLQNISVIWIALSFLPQLLDNSTRLFDTTLYGNRPTPVCIL